MAGPDIEKEMTFTEAYISGWFTYECPTCGYNFSNDDGIIQAKYHWELGHYNVFKYKI